MIKQIIPDPANRTVEAFLAGKSEVTVSLFHHFVREFQQVGDLRVLPAKTMIGLATPRKRIAYITQLGRNFIHVYFFFQEPYSDNLCFEKITNVPGSSQFNHHFRMFQLEDVNAEVRDFMRLAYRLGL